MAWELKFALTLVICLMHRNQTWMKTDLLCLLYDGSQEPQLLRKFGCMCKKFGYGGVSIHLCILSPCWYLVSIRS